MASNAKQINISINHLNIDYVTFGKGNKYLIIIPGVGDALKNVKGLATFYAHKYEEYANDYKVYVISRRNKMPKKYNIADMAQDIYTLIEHLNINECSVMGISQGGMVAQHLAINYPDIVKKLVLIVTAPEPNAIMTNTINNWLSMIKKKEYRNILTDTALKSYVGKSANKYTKVYNLFYKAISPKSYIKYETMLKACLKHNTTKELKKITAQTLIIGAKLDQVLGYEGSLLLNSKIKDSKLILYDDYSHGVYDQLKDFNKPIYEYLTRGDK